jgi:hypothetical protein
MEKYQEVSGDTCYFGDWGYTVIDTTYAHAWRTSNERPAPPRLGGTA